MASYKEVLAGLIAKAPDNISESELSQLMADAQVLARHNAAPAPVAAPTRLVPRDHKTTAREQYTKLRAAPLPAGASDRLKVERAAEEARLLAIMTDRVGYTDANGYEISGPYVPPGGDAA